MAKIPRYQQGNLASSMVGTPGIDTSMSSALQGGARALDNVAGTLQSVATYEWQLQKQEEARIQSEQRAARKEFETLTYENSVVQLKAEHDNAIDNMDKQLREQSKWKTDGAMENWKTSADDMLNERLESIQNPKLKLLAAKALTASQSSKQQEFSNYLFSRQGDIGKANIQSAADALALSVNDANLSPAEVRAKLGAYEADAANQKGYINNYGPEAGAQIRKDQSDAARTYLSSIANGGDLNALNAAIGQFNDIVKGDDVEEFYARQRSLATAVAAEARKTQEYNTAVAVNEKLGDITAKSAAGTLTQQEVDETKQFVKKNKGAPGAIRVAQNALTQQEKDARRKDATVATQQQKEARANEIIENRRTLQSNYEKVIYKGKPIKGTSPQQLSELYADIADAELKKNITPDAANAMRRNVRFATTMFNKKEPEAAAHAERMMKISDNIMKSARTYTTDPQVNKVFGVKLNNAYFDTLENWEKRKRRLSTAKEQQNLMDAIVPLLLQDARDEVTAQRKRAK